MWKFITGTVLFGFVWYATPTWSEGKQDQIRIQVKVAADEIADEINNYFTRELRQLPGVAIIPSGGEADWYISVMGYKIQSRINQPPDYTISIAVIKSDAAVLASSLQQSLQEISKREISRNNLAGHYLFSVGGADQLKERCAQWVTEFNTQHLESQKRRRQTNSGISPKQGKK